MAFGLEHRGKEKVERYESFVNFAISQVRERQAHGPHHR
jgi:hypothetical protein